MYGFTPGVEGVFCVFANFSAKTVKFWCFLLHFLPILEACPVLCLEVKLRILNRYAENHRKSNALSSLWCASHNIDLFARFALLYGKHFLIHSLLSNLSSSEVFLARVAIEQAQTCESCKRL